MKAREHPAFSVESDRLATAYDRIEDDLAHYETATSDLVVKAQVEAEASIVRQRISRLRELREQPYFGRVDWQSGGDGTPEVFYVGKSELRECDIFSCWDTLVGDLYYDERTNRENGELLLKRTFEIADRTLDTISDDWVHESLRDTLFAEAFTDSLLVRLLQETRGKRLYDIVATIQSQQYAIIRAPETQILVVQGVPGSGKTSVALHRIAYLLYQHRGDSSYTPGRLLVLGPNPMFMRYIANVLPELGERRVPQRTFTDWLIERLGSDMEHEPQEESLEVLTDTQRPRSERLMRYRNALNKGSLRMAQLLDAYVRILYRYALEEVQDLTVTAFSIRRGTLRAQRSADELRSILSGMRVAYAPYNTRRDAARDLIVLEVLRELGVREDQSDYPDLRKAIDDQVRQHFSEWRALNVSVAYRRLLRTRDLLFEAGDGIFSAWELELLAYDAPTQQTPFRFSDLAALLYLKLLLDGTGGQSYRHIVIDEAQDITPLHLMVLHRYSYDGSMTVLGDLNQGIFMHHGVHTWDELQEAVGGVDFSQANISQSYRSTHEIIEYANRMLRRTGLPDSDLAEPIARHGPNPTQRGFESTSDLAASLPGLVRGAQQHGWQSVAIVCKSLAGCERLVEALRDVDMPDYQFIRSRDAEYAGDVAVLPVYLTKGLEFDVVIVADADSETYTPDALDARLLYVALTRASHELYVCWVGEPTPYLDPDIRAVQCHPPLGDALEPDPITIAAYTAEHPEVDTDWCVTRLAARGKLDLLRAGRIDETVLDLLVAEFGDGGSAGTGEVVIEPLAADLAHRIELDVVSLEAEKDTTCQEALAFTQLTYGLLRNTLNKFGIPALNEGAGQLPTEIVHLVTLWRAVDRRTVELAIAPATTRGRILQAVDRDRHEQAESYLNRLIDHGIVATQHNNRLQVPQEQVRPLLAVSLGFLPDSWEVDLLQSLPCLPDPVAPDLWAAVEVADD